MNGRAANKTIVVTGGALGIGRAACLLLGKHDAKVAVTDISASFGSSR